MRSFKNFEFMFEKRDVQGLQRLFRMPNNRLKNLSAEVRPEAQECHHKRNQD